MPKDADLRSALAGAFSHALGYGLGVCVLELAARELAAAVRFPDALTFAAATLAHLGQLAPLVLLFAVLHLAGQAFRSTSAGGAVVQKVQDALRLLTVPARILRLAVVWGVAALLLGERAKATLQLPYHAGALFAGPVLVLAALAELAVARLRAEAPPARARVTGVSAWVAALLLHATLVTSRVGFPLTGALAASVLVLVWVAVLAGDRRFTARSLALGYGLLVLGIVTDAHDPALRRFAATHAPHAVLGRTLAQWATDLDGDGASGWLGLDCDDMDPFRSPFARDLPDDGVDQNCRGGDASLQRSVARYLPGGIHHPPRPRARPAVPPDVFLITLDAARPELLEEADLLPRTRDFLSRCIHFTGARSAAPSTGESLVALHTGVFARHVVTDEGWFIDLAAPGRGKMSTPPTLAAALAISAGYRTAAVLPSFHAENVAFMTGHLEGGTVDDVPGAFHAPAAVVLAAARKHSAGGSPGTPVHVRVHLMDLHAPYLDGSGYDAYRRSAAALDPPLADYLGELPASAVIVVAADHGEAFGEHGYREHGHSLFDEELRVPLALCAPPELGLGAARTIDAPVSLADVTPTLLELLGVDVPYRRQGASLMPVLTGTGVRAPGFVYFENLAGGQLGVLAGCDKWIEDTRTGFRVLFDVCADPGETRDLRRTEPARAARMDGLLAAIVDLDLDVFRSSQQPP